MLRVIRDVCESGYEFGWEHSLPAPVPARRPRKGDAKVRTGVRRRSGCVTGAGGEASKARNAEVCLRAGWRMRRPASPTRRQPTLKKRSAYGQCGLRFFSRYSGGGYSRKKARPHRPHAVADTRGLGTMLVRARQSAQPVHAVRRTLFTHRFSRSARNLFFENVNFCNDSHLFVLLSLRIEKMDVL